MSSTIRKYISQVTTLLTGTGLANLIPIIVTPILSRIYEPSAFGLLAIFVSMTTIIGSVSNGRYELAVPLPKERKDSLSITVGAVLIAIVVSIVLFISSLLFAESLAKMVNNIEFKVWITLVPLSVLSFGISNPLNYYHTRCQRFREIAIAKIIRALSMAMLQLWMGYYLHMGASGLVLGFLIASALESLVLIFYMREEKWVLIKLKMRDSRALLKRYKRFPKYSAPGAISNTLSTHLVELLIPALYSIGFLGQYAIVIRVLGMPLRMIGQAISQVYFQKAAHDKNTIESTWPAYKITLAMLVVIAVPIFVILSLFATDLFEIVFGEQWQGAGRYAMILLPLFFIRFIVSPIAVTCSIYEKQNIALIWQLSLLGSLLINFFLASTFSLEFELFLSMFTWSYFVLYLAMFAFTYRLSYSHNKMRRS